MVTPLTLGLTKDPIEKNQEQDENMAEMMIQLDLLTKPVTGVPKAVNIIGISKNLSQEATAYDKDVQYFCQMGVYYPNYQRQKMSTKVGTKEVSGEIVVWIGEKEKLKDNFTYLHMSVKILESLRADMKHYWTKDMLA